MTGEWYPEGYWDLPENKAILNNIFEAVSRERIKFLEEQHERLYKLFMQRLEPAIIGRKLTADEFKKVVENRMELESENKLLKSMLKDYGVNVELRLTGWHEHTGGEEHV